MIELFIFILVIFLYVHIVVQYKSGEDLDVYEIDYYDNTNLQKLCDALQPFLFHYLEVFPDLRDQEMPKQWILYEKGDPVHPFEVPRKQARIAMSTVGKDKNYYSETPIEDFTVLDSYLKPAFTMQREYAVLGGTNQTTTPFVYHCNSRRFLVIQDGEICLKMAPWKKNIKNLYEIHDYQNGQIRSLMDVWSPSAQYRRSWEKIEFVEVVAKKGQVIYIPPFWGYSIKYQEPRTQVLQLTYSTIFNRIAFIGDIIQCQLQKENTVYKKWPSAIRDKHVDPEEDTTTDPIQEPVQLTQID
jgi:hypothetical protein